MRLCEACGVASERILCFDCLRQGRQEANYVSLSDGIAKLISDAALAEEMYGLDDLESFAREHRKSLKPNDIPQNHAGD